MANEIGRRLPVSSVRREDIINTLYENCMLAIVFRGELFRQNRYRFAPHSRKDTDAPFRMWLCAYAAVLSRLRRAAEFIKNTHQIGTVSGTRFSAFSGDTDRLLPMLVDQTSA